MAGLFMWSQLGLECPRWLLGWADPLQGMSLQVLGFLTLQLASPRAQKWKLPALLTQKVTSRVFY